MNISKTLKLVEVRCNVFNKDTQGIEEMTFMLSPKRGSIEKALDLELKSRNSVLIDVLEESEKCVKAKMDINTFLQHASTEIIE